MDFEQIQMRLIARLRERVRNGDLTERGFARAVGISQPHVHKVLKGARTLSPDSLDIVLKYFNYSILDLCTKPELLTQVAKLTAIPEPGIDVPFLDSRIGPGAPWVSRFLWHEQHPVPCSVARSSERVILVRLSEDPAMAESTSGFDIAVLDGGGQRSLRMQPEAIYAVNRGPDTVLRRIRVGISQLYLVTDDDRDDPSRWERIPNTPGVLRGQVTWLGREGDRLFEHSRHLRETTSW